MTTQETIAEVTPKLRYLSLGCGVQSSAIYCMAVTGAVQFDCAIFADTQSEPSWVYDQLSYLMSLGGPEIHVVSYGSLELDLLSSLAGNARPSCFIPAWIDDKGKRKPMRRGCTRYYKIRPIQKKARALAHPMRRGEFVVSLQGISTDEASRMKDSRDKWLRFRYPLIDMGMSRADCESWLLTNGFRVPEKSACIFCPFTSDHLMARLSPDERARANALDDAMRDARNLGIESPVYVHKSLRPLRDIFGADKKDQFGNECEGACGV